jgi:hypothetical protein
MTPGVARPHGRSAGQRDNRESGSVPRERLSFRQRDLKAALKAAQDGIVIIPGEPIPEEVAAPKDDPEKAAIKEAIRNEVQKHVPPDER